MERPVASPDQEVVGVGSNNTTINAIVKGKRTKRQRPQSPIPFAITAHSSSGEGGGCGVTVPGDNIISKEIVLFSSPTSASNELLYQDSTEEEEDMANCLILLATRPVKHTGDDHIINVMNQNYGYINKPSNSRRFMETANSTGNGAKAGYYVYECKTCNRTFPSFQALGGHRASHKKPKVMGMEKSIGSFAISSDEEDHHHHHHNHNHHDQVHLKNMSNSLSLQLMTNRANNNNNNNNNNNHNASLQNTTKYNNNKSKVHECSICGAEFTSGQALGGHMRRHRGPVPINHHHTNGNSTTNNTQHLSLSSSPPMRMESTNRMETNLSRTSTTMPKPKAVISLDLDLNLPAPPEDEHNRESTKLPFASTQQEKPQPPPPPPPLVFSAPTLVDCHY
ncbi:hypothetical protein ACFE04_000524 [Oxalis oulophora]